MGERYTVHLANGKLEEVGCKYTSTNGGVVMFYDDDDRLIVAYGPLGWTLITRQEDDE